MIAGPLSSPSWVHSHRRRSAKKRPICLGGQLNLHLPTMMITEAGRPFRIAHVNPAWELLCGYAAAEALGREAPALLHGPLTDRAAAMAFTRSIEETGFPASMIVTNYTKSGEAFLNHVVTLPLRECGGPILYHAAILTPIPPA